MKSDAAIPRNLTFRSVRAWSLSMKRTRRRGRLPARHAVPAASRHCGRGFRCHDLSALRKRLTDQGFAFAEAQGRLVVPAEQASGVAVLFEE